MSDPLAFRPGEVQDIPLILNLVRELAEYEGLLHEVVATEELLNEWLFDKGIAEVLLGEVSGDTVGYALFFHNFSTFLGRSGVYLEDLYIRKPYRGSGYGKAFLRELAQITLHRGCGRLEWSCMKSNRSGMEFYEAMKAREMNEWTVFRLEGDTLVRLAEP